MMVDGNDRPGLAITGAYPQLSIFANADNGRHGGTLRLGAYTDASASTFKHWVIGTAARNARFLHIGYSDRSDPNPRGLLLNRIRLRRRSRGHGA